MATKDLGAVTAYAYAKAHGYSGTEAQFETKMGELPQAVLDAQNAVATVTGVQAQATQLATTAAPTATYNHTTNKIEFGIPKGNGIASITHTGTSGSVKTYTITFNDGQTTTFDVTDGELTYEYAEENLAFNDGYYDSLTAGSAEQLISNVMEEDTKPYVFRTTGGNLDVGDRKIEELVGGTIAWNQHADFDDLGTGTVNGLGVSAANGKFHLTGTPAVTSSFGIIPANTYNKIKPIYKHKYLLMFDTQQSLPTGQILFVIYINGSGWTHGQSFYVNNSKIFECTVAESKASEFVFSPQAGTAPYDITFTSYLVDLTQMFGSTVADAVYAMEQAEAGAGVAWFRKYFPKPYYAYNAGSLQSVNVASGINTGFNQWDGTHVSGKVISNSGVEESSSGASHTDYIHVVGGATYFSNNNGLANRFCAHYYNSAKEWIGYGFGGVVSGGRTFTIPNDAHYLIMNYAGSQQNDICINLSWDGERDGEYEPYDAHVYNYDSDIQLRGIPSLDEFGNLQYDGDIYESDGTVTRKYGIVDLGTMTWTKLSESAWNCFYSSISGKAVGTENIFCSKYPRSTMYNTQTDKIIDGNSGGVNVYIRDSQYTSAADLKASLSGVYAIYELATPTEESANPFTSPQIINDFGTEEWVDAGVQAGTRDVSIPVGHNSGYTVNLKAKLEMAPNSPNGDGEYLVRQKNGENEYVPFTWVGDHPDLSAGSAHQLISTVQENDQTPYLFRTSGGSVDIGDREFINGIVGGTIAWNQIGSLATSGSGGITITNHGSYITLTGTGVDNGPYIFVGGATGPKIVYGHKYLLDINKVLDGVDLKGYIQLYASTSTAGSGNRYRSVLFNESIIFANNTRTTDDKEYDYAGPWIRVKSGYEINMDLSANMFDLTQMFGSTIADYLYSLEQTTPGTGVAWFKKYFSKPYYEYNTGELMSISGLQNHDLTGFNQWDEEWELGGINYQTGATYVDNNNIRSKNFIPVVPLTQYYYKAPDMTAVIIVGYDADYRYIKNIRYNTSNATFVTSNSNIRYIKFCTFANPNNYGNTYNHDICINISWDGSRNGEYEPYVKHNYPLDDSLTLRGIPKLDANNELYYDGDIYEPDGIVTRKYGVVDLGTLNWTAVTASASDNNYYFKSSGLASLIKIPASTFMPALMLMKGYDTTSWSAFYNRILDAGNTYSEYNPTLKLCAVNTGGEVRISGAGIYTDAAAFKAAMSGVYLVYELATPTTEEAEPYTTPQIVDDFGTEEFVIDSEIAVPIPVGHNTDYPINLVAKLEMAPNSPDGDGDYIVRQTNGENEYVLLVIPNELPTMPTTNGTYVLKVTVSNGTPTLSWVAQ